MFKPYFQLIPRKGIWLWKGFSPAVVGAKNVAAGSSLSPAQFENLCHRSLSIA
jgi:hypothetical protein